MEVLHPTNEVVGAGPQDRAGPLASQPVKPHAAPPPPGRPSKTFDAGGGPFVEREGRTMGHGLQVITHAIT